MENTSAATTIVQISELRRKPADLVLRRCGQFLHAGLKTIAAAWFDPRNCNAFWVGAYPETWDSRR